MTAMDIIVITAACAALPAFGWVGWRLLRSRREAHHPALRDQLTGLMNDRAFAERAVDVMDERRDVSGEMVVLSFRIDGLASIRERFGSGFADFVVRFFAEKAKAEIREDDLLFRLGQAEFCSILPSTSERDARAIAERICAAFSAKKLRARKKENVRPSASVGLASSTVVGFRIDRLKAAADAALAEGGAQEPDRIAAYADFVGAEARSAA